MSHYPISLIRLTSGGMALRRLRAAGARGELRRVYCSRFGTDSGRATDAMRRPSAMISELCGRRLRRSRWLALVLALILLLAPAGWILAYPRASYVSGASVLDTGGGRAGSGEFAALVSVGQPSPPGRMTDGRYQNLGGFVSSVPIDVAPPVIDHSPVTTASQGESITVVAEVTDQGSGVLKATLRYRIGGETDSGDSVQMQGVGGGGFQGTIPGSSVTERGIAYYMSATDSASNQGATEVCFVSVSVTDLAIDEAMAAGSYRMISVPIELPNASPQDVLSDDLGAYDNAKWRLGRWSPGDSGYHEYTVNWSGSTDDFAPGRGYWLIVRDGGSIDASGSSVDFSEDHVITLQPGWNQIGCPFAFSVDWSDVERDEDVENTLWDYVDGDYQPGTALRPWNGYWVKNAGGQTAQLAVPPTESGGTGAPMSPEMPEKLWEVRLVASCGKYRDTHNYLGVSAEASDGWDRLDLSEPPPAWEYVSLYFPHRDREFRAGDYATDFRTEFEEGQTWEFLVDTNAPECQLELDVGGVESVPEALMVLLLDVATGDAVDVRRGSHYAYPVGEADGTRRFLLAVGTAEYVVEVRSGLVPERYALSRNRPNPFSSETEIRYQIPMVADQGMQHVTLRIYNIHGREVRTLVRGNTKVGYHTVVWDGRDNHRACVPSGTYFFTLKAGSFAGTKRLLLLR